MSDATVLRNEERRRYEISVGEEVAGWIDYVEHEDGAVEFTHTIVPPKYGGQGLGTTLTRAALEDLRSRDVKKLIPTCSFTARYVEKHPEYSDLVE